MLELDKLDKKIVLELYQDARMSQKQLARKLKVSKEVVNYRINRLIKEEIIKKFIPLINFSVLGYTIYRIQFKFRKKETENWQKFFNQIPQTSWLVELSGNWDLVVLFWIKENAEFFEIIEQINNHFGENIQEMQFTIVNKVDHFPPNYLLENYSTANKGFCYSIGQSEKKASLDEVDEILIKELMDDGRASILSLAKQINYSATNVKYHLNKLIKQKVIESFIPVIDHTKLNLTHFKVTLNLINPKQKKQLREFLKHSQPVVYITESYGKYDLEFEFITERINQLFSFIEQISQQFPLKQQEIIFNNQELLVNKTPFGIKNG